MSECFVVAGATGRVGSVVARALSSRGHRVRAVVRRARSAPALPPGVQAAGGALQDRRFLAEVLAGAAGFFTLLPEDVAPEDFHGERRRMADAVAGAVADSGIPHVVMLSAIAAGVAEGNGPARGLHHMENALRATGAAVTALRPAYFQDNLVSLLPSARDAGVYPNFMPSADVPFPTVATRDVGRLAAERLLAPPSANETVDVLGPAYSVRQMAEALGRALEREVRVVDIPSASHVAALTSAGVPGPLAAIYAEMFAGVAAGIFAPRGQTQVMADTTLEEWLPSVLAAGNRA